MIGRLNTAVMAMVAAAAGCLCGTAAGQNLVVNGSFETGNTDGWSRQPALIGSSFLVTNNYEAHDGAFVQAFQADGGLEDSIAQVIPTTTGRYYRISLWVYNLTTEGDRLRVYWSSTIALEMSPVAVPEGQWTQVTVDVLATSSSSTLSIAGLDGPGSFWVDDIAVTPTLPPNDTCAGAVDVSAGGTFTGSLIGSTLDGQFGCWANWQTGDVWYVFDAPQGLGGRLGVTTCGSFAAYGVDTALELRAGCDAGSSQLFCNDDWPFGGEPANACSGGIADSAARINVAGGSRTYVRVRNFTGSTPGRFTLNVTFEEFGVRNGSFEIGTGTPRLLPQGSGAINSWTVTRGSIDWTASSDWQSADGNRSIDLQGLNSNGGVRQTIFTRPGQWYRLTFALAGNPDQPGIKRVRARVDDRETEFMFDGTGYSHANMGYSDNFVDFPATANTTEIEFFSSMAATGSYGAVIDNVRLRETACPGDFNASGSVTVQDIFDFFASYFSGATAADVNNSGSVTVQDIFDFLAAYFTGCQ